MLVNLQLGGSDKTIYSDTTTQGALKWKKKHTPVPSGASEVGEMNIIGLIYLFCKQNMHHIQRLVEGSIWFSLSWHSQLLAESTQVVFTEILIYNSSVERNYFDLRLKNPSSFGKIKFSKINTIVCDPPQDVHW